MSSKYKKAARPVDKEQMYLIASSLGTTQDNQDIRVSTVAETYTGGHIQVSLQRVSGGGVIQCALMMVPEGVTNPTLTTTDANPFAQPEEYVLWGASVYLGSNSVEPVILKDRIKTMRKMKNGDALVFACRGSVATVGTVTALVTAFFNQ